MEYTVYGRVVLVPAKPVVIEAADDEEAYDRAIEYIREYGEVEATELAVFPPVPDEVEEKAAKCQEAWEMRGDV
jgi:hypothetical protein